MENSKILIVEDESITALAIKHKLERLNYNILDIESSGIDAIKKAEELEPDLILMDILLKGEIDGIETANKINQRFNIPIIYLTAHFEDEIIERAKLSKNYGFIGKPFSDGNLKSSIEIALYKNQIEEGLSESEDKYRKIVETANEGIWAMDHKFKTTFVNQKMAEMLGYTTEEMTGKPVTFFMFDDELNDHNLKMKSREIGISEQYKRRFRHKNGSEILSNVSVTALKDEENNFAGSFAMFTDITQRIKAQKDLKRSENKYKELFNNISSGVAVYESINNNEDFIFKDLNKSAEKIENLKKEDIIGKSLLQIFPNVKDFGLLEVLQRVHETGIPEHFPTSFYKDQRITGWRDNYVYKLPSGEVVAAYDDITKRKKAGEELKESEKKFKVILNNVNDMISLNEIDDKGLPGKYIEINDVGIKRLGYSKEELSNLSPKDIVAPDKLPFLHQNVEKIHENGVYTFETVHISKDGKRIPVEINSHIINYKGQNVYLAVSRDITERINAEKEIIRTNIYHRGLIETSLDPIVTLDYDGKIVDVNNAAEKITGYTRNKLIGAEIFDYFTDPSKARKDFKDIIEKRRVQNYELEIKHKNGKITPISYNASIYKNEEGNPVGVFAAARDVTEIKLAEKNIKSSLKEKEVLLREIHHRVKNNLQIISSLLSLQSNYINDTEALDVFKESQNRVKSMAMIHEMLYRSDCLIKINFGEYINELTNNLLYNYKIHPNIVQIKKKIDNIHFDVNTSVPCGLIVNELVSNCLKHAFPWFETPELLKTYSSSLEFDQCKINIDLKANDENYILTIADNGIGFPDNIDFRKTDSLGLELVNSLVEQLDGTIELDKTSGTKFTIMFKPNDYNGAL